MSEFQITEVAETAIDSAVSGGVAKVTQILSGENVSEMISGAVNVLCSFAEVSPQIASEAFDAIVEMTKQAIMSKERIVINTTNSKYKIIDKIDESILKAADKVDFSDPKASETFNNFVSTLKDLMVAGCESLNPPSLFQRFKKR